ncbi:MAG: hypothetical protein IPP08_03885 [Chlorobiota bacterium]|jgi:hypothetical protein|nr:hypothetical protein [Chlorobiota bacterium]QQS67315.1 MAG: hypothetical protein IPP08_03885 [Chlorobiota bacterium]
MKKLILSILVLTTIVTNGIFASNKSKLTVNKAKADTLLTIISRVKNHEFLSIPANAVWITRAVFSSKGNTVSLYTGLSTRQALNVPVIYSIDGTKLTCVFRMTDGVDWKFTARISGIQLNTIQVAEYSSGHIKYNKTLIKN